MGKARYQLRAKCNGHYQSPHPAASAGPTISTDNGHHLRPVTFDFSLVTGAVSKAYYQLPRAAASLGPLSVLLIGVT
jgi:hypothetical protein